MGYMGDLTIVYPKPCSIYLSGTIKVVGLEFMGLSFHGRIWHEML